MMWKNEYELGNELIDAQHKELFKRVEILSKIVVGEDAASRKDECIDAILFLKDYAVKHFAAEEAFQESLNYKYIEFHKAIHSSFVNSVLEAEAKLVETDFSLPVIKEFCGFLGMWLIYHVAGADKKIVSDDVLSVAEFAIAVSYEDCVLEGMKELLSTVIGDSIDVTAASEAKEIENAIYVETDYDEKRVMSFTLSSETALNLVNAITNLKLTEVDELAYAALTQFAKTICGNTASSMSKSKKSSKNIKVQSDSLMDGGEFFINKVYGSVSFSLKQKNLDK